MTEGLLTLEDYKIALKAAAYVLCDTGFHPSEEWIYNWLFDEGKRLLSEGKING